MDWLSAVMNAVSLAVGVAVGSYMTFHLTKRELRKTLREFTDNKSFKDLGVVLAKSRELLESSEAKAFLIELTAVMRSLTGKGERKELIVLPTEEK